MEYNFGQKRAKAVNENIIKIQYEPNRDNPDKDDESENMEKSDPEEEPSKDNSDTSVHYQ
jgi:hypothetical protein